MRGHIDAGDYKQFIFPLLFFKRISDVYDEEYAEAAELNEEEAELAPIYDKLPMLFAPQNHVVIEREYIAPAMPNLIEVWGEAKDLADEFWKETEFRTFH